MTRAHAKRFEEMLNGLMEDVWADKSSRAVKDNSKFVNLVQVISEQPMSEFSTPSTAHASPARAPS